MIIKTLVVDNNPVLLKAIASILEKEGCDVKVADNGLKALELLQDYSPDIVFTDLIMPQVSGEQLCKILRNSKKHRGVYLVVISAIIVEDRERIIREGCCDDCIAKGNISDIRAHIHGVLDSYRQSNGKSTKRSRGNITIPNGVQFSEITSELLLDRRHISTIMANIVEGIIELSDQGKIVTINRAAMDMLSCSEESVTGMKLNEAVNWQNFNVAVTNWINRELTAEGMGSFTIREDKPLILGNTVITASFIPVREAESVFGLCILHNISRQFHAENYSRQMDNALRLLKKMDAMSCMAGGVSHDFNNLLTTVCGNLDIVALQLRKGDPESQLRRVRQAKNAALAAVDLTRQISCFSSFGITIRNRENIVRLVGDTAELFFTDQKEISFTLQAKKQGWYAYIDSSEISRAIVNVLQNSVEASRAGVINISIDQEIVDAPRLLSGQYISGGKYVRIDIDDKGPGIEEEQLFKIFDPYYSTKERGSMKGMGLGLTIVYATLRNHGGYVIVNSKPDVGTTVSLYLPTALDTDTAQGTNDTMDCGDQLVVLFERDEQMAEIGKTMLQHLGFAVILVNSGEKLLDEFKKIGGEPVGSIPLVIMDISENNGESAIERCRLLHALEPEIKIIALGGSVLDPVMEDCRKYGFVNALQKPYSMDALKHIINSALHD